MQKTTTCKAGTHVIVIEQWHILRGHWLGLERLKTEEVGFTEPRIVQKHGDV